MSQVWIICFKTKELTKSSHNPPMLLLEQQIVIVAFIEMRYHNGNFVSQWDILNFIEDNFGKCLTYGWFDSFLSMNAFRFCQMIISPREQTQLQILREFLDQYLTIIKKRIPLVPTDLIFNTDKCEFTDWEKHNKKFVLILYTVQNATRHYPVNHKIRYQMLIYCITAAKDVYYQLFISSDLHVTELFDMGVRDEIDLKIKIALSFYVT
jgi:hypothetical protein